MTDKQYVNTITSGHFLYWNMLGKLRGIQNNEGVNIKWLSGDIHYNYFTNTYNIEHLISSMNNGDIPKNLLFLTDNLTDDPTEPFKATGLFKEGLGTTGMAHKLTNASFPKCNKNLNLFQVVEISQLKAAGAILNTVFEYNLFSFNHFVDMFNIEGVFFYLAEYDGLPVGACMSQHGEDFINISWVGTLPGYRRLGIAAYLMQAAEQKGFVQGKNIAVLHARKGAIGAYQAIGYNEYCRGIELELN